MMNYNFFRRATSSIIASVFALNFGIGSIKPVSSQEVAIKYDCQKNSSKFHIPLADKKPLNIIFGSFFIANLSTKTNITTTQTGQGKSVITREERYKFQGLDRIIAGKLSEDSNFRVINTESAKEITKLTQDLNLKNLRKLRDDYGVESVLLLTVNDFQVNGDKVRNYLVFQKSQKINDVSVTLNYRLVDTTTGYFVDAGKGEGYQNESYTSKITTPTIKVDFKIDETGAKLNYPINVTLTNKSRTEAQDNVLASNTKEGIVGKLLAVAVEDAMNQVVEKLSFNSQQTSCKLRIPTVVVDADLDKTVTLNKGKLHGYAKDKELSFEEFKKLIKDPITGQVLRIKTKSIKAVKIKLTEVKPHFSVGKIIFDSDDNTENYVKLKLIVSLSKKHKLYAKLIPQEVASLSNQGNSDTNSQTNNDGLTIEQYGKKSHSAEDLKLKRK